MFKAIKRAIKAVCGACLNGRHSTCGSGCSCSCDKLR